MYFTNFMMTNQGLGLGISVVLEQTKVSSSMGLRIELEYHIDYELLFIIYYFMFLLDDLLIQVNRIIIYFNLVTIVVGQKSYIKRITRFQTLSGVKELLLFCSMIVCAFPVNTLQINVYSKLCNQKVSRKYYNIILMYI